MSPVKSTQPLVPVTLIPFGSTLLRVAETPWLALSTASSSEPTIAVAAA